MSTLASIATLVGLLSAFVGLVLLGLALVEVLDRIARRYGL